MGVTVTHVLVALGKREIRLGDLLECENERKIKSAQKKREGINGERLRRYVNERAFTRASIFSVGGAPRKNRARNAAALAFSEKIARACVVGRSLQAGATIGGVRFSIKSLTILQYTKQLKVV